MATTDLVSQAGSGGANVTMDGGTYIYVGSAATWAALRDSAECSDLFNPSGGGFGVGLQGSTTTDRWYQQWRSGMSFDLGTVVGADNVITAASLWIMTADTITTALGHTSIVVTGFSPTNPAAYTYGDNDQFNYASYASIATSSLSPNTRYELVLNAAGIAFLNGLKTGVASLGLLTEWDRSNTPPTWVSDAITKVMFWAVDSGSSVQPYLRVTYETSNPSVNVFYRRRR